jgi:hypothetical protein
MPRLLLGGRVHPAARPVRRVAQDADGRGRQAGGEEALVRVVIAETDRQLARDAPFVFR